MGHPTGKELSSEQPLGGRGEQGLFPDLVGETTKGEHKPGLLSVLVTLKRFGKPWSIITDSGTSSNYVRRLSLEGNQKYADALTADEGDSITVRLATGVRVTVPKGPFNLGLKFVDFNSVERTLLTRDMILFSVYLGLNAIGHGSIGDPKH